MNKFDKTIKEMLIGFKGSSDTPVKHEPKHPDNFSKHVSNALNKIQKCPNDKLPIQPTDNVGKSGVEIQIDSEETLEIQKKPLQELETFVIVDEGKKIKIVLNGFEFSISKLVAKAISGTLRESFHEGFTVLQPMEDGCILADFGNIKIIFEPALIQAITRFSNKLEACMVNPLNGKGIV